jgi:hypothetical protein
MFSTSTTEVALIDSRLGGCSAGSKLDRVEKALLPVENVSVTIV